MLRAGIWAQDVLNQSLTVPKGTFHKRHSYHQLLHGMDLNAVPTETFYTPVNCTMRAKVNVFVADWDTWVPVLVKVSGKKPWPMYPQINDIRMIMYQDFTKFQATLGDPSMLQFRKARKSAIATVTDPEYVAPDTELLSEDWFVDPHWDLYLTIGKRDEAPASRGLRACDGLGTDPKPQKWTNFKDEFAVGEHRAQWKSNTHVLGMNDVFKAHVYVQDTKVWESITLPWVKTETGETKTNMIMLKKAICELLSLPQDKAKQKDMRVYYNVGGLSSGHPLKNGHIVDKDCWYTVIIDPDAPVAEHTPTTDFIKTWEVCAANYALETEDEPNSDD